ncbi:L-rhamnose-binding lectin CSL2-like [Enoplosus armatus]|uniref:L-rhamnose-binding lectin CSL2-like n=1 Tax=Enoplosus armatus TaxID=215367 RepID=UPI003995CD47
MTREEATLTCDLQDFTQKLNCYNGVIVVQNVESSHREAEVCVDGVPPSRLEEPLCSSTPVLNIIKKRCNGQYRCAVPMDLCHAAKPCMTRTSKKVCKYRAPHSHRPSTTCGHPDTLQVMADRCDGKHTCSVRASNLIFSNPCPGTRKYLKYSYTCVDPGNSEERN